MWAGNTANDTEQLKNPNWQEADQLAMYKHSQGAEPDVLHEFHVLELQIEMNVYDSGSFIFFGSAT